MKQNEQPLTREELLQKLNNKYKGYSWARGIFRVLSIISCTIPEIVVALDVGLTYKSSESKWALGGTAIAMSAIMLLIVLRNFVKENIPKIPWTIPVMVSFGIMTLLLWALKRVIDDAFAICLTGLIGACVAFIFNLVYMYCKSRADEIKDEYEFERRKT